MILTFPWPPRELSPNARVHWAVKAKAAKNYKADCLILCQAAKIKCGKMDAPYFSIEFCPPNSRRRDIDNCFASFKGGIDAISHQLGVDDSKFIYFLSRGPVQKHGGVRVIFPEGAIRPGRIAA